MTAPLVIVAGGARITDARALALDVEAAGGTLPQRLNNLLESATLLRVAPTRTDPAGAILDAAVAGDLTADKLDRLANDAAVANTAEQYRAELATRAETLIARRFAAELADGGADEILDSMRPEFDAAAQAIADGIAQVNLNQDYDEFVESATPEQLAAYQQLKAATVTVERIITVPVKYFGLQTISAFSVIARPSIEGAGALADAVLFTRPPGSNIARDSHDYREFTPQRARRGMRFSVWLRGGLRLNTIAEVRESVRGWAEAKFDANLSPEHRGVLTNPYAKTAS